MKPVFVWIFPLAVLAMAVYVAWRNYPWWNVNDAYGYQFEKWMGLAIGLLVTAVLVGLAAGLGSGLSSLVGSYCDQEWRQCWRAEMVSMRSSDGISGSISGGLFMMSGHVNSRLVYFYYTQNSNGSFQPRKWTPDSNTNIFEEDREDGEIFQYDKKFKSRWVEWFGEPDGDVGMVFHIPKGSLKKTFALE